MISLIVVNYRSAALAIEALASARRATSSPLQTIVVDNSTDPAEVAQLRPHADIVLSSRTNRGYGGAVNDARLNVSGSTIVIANADVSFGTGSIDRLMNALDAGAAVAGPALFWDDAHEWILPPSDPMTLTGKIDEALASRSRRWSRWRDRRRTRARIAFWRLEQATEMDVVSGAVLALRTADYDEAGGFDERFPLYFEETDLLRRLRRRGKKVVYVPAARCRHLFNQSAGADAERAASLYAASERAFLAKWYGRAGLGLVDIIGRSGAREHIDLFDGRVQVPPGQVIVEASPLANFDTAAGHFPRRSAVELPAEVWAAYRAPVLYLRAVELATGRVSGPWALRRS